MAWIETVAVGQARGRLAKLYDAALARAGRVYGIVQLHSLDPGLLDASMKLYARTTTHPKSPLSRRVRELLAVVVSRSNDCFY